MRAWPQVASHSGNRDRAGDIASSGSWDTVGDTVGTEVIQRAQAGRLGNCTLGTTRNLSRLKGRLKIYSFINVSKKKKTAEQNHHQQNIKSWAEDKWRPWGLGSCAARWKRKGKRKKREDPWLGWTENLPPPTLEITSVFISNVNLFFIMGFFFFLAFINIQNKLPGWRGSSVIEHLIYDPEPGLTPNTRKNKQNPKLYCFETWVKFVTDRFRGSQNFNNKLSGCIRLLRKFITKTKQDWHKLVIIIYEKSHFLLLIIIISLTLTITFSVNKCIGWWLKFVLVKQYSCFRYSCSILEFVLKESLLSKRLKTIVQSSAELKQSYTMLKVSITIF